MIATVGLAVALAAAPVPPPPPPGPSAAEAEAHAEKAEAEAAAAAKAAQDVDAKLVQIQQQVEQLERTRQATDDLRKKVEDLESASARAAKLSVSVAGTDEGEGGSGGHDKDGHYVRSDDGLFLLRPSGRIQARYEGALSEGAPGEPDPNRSTFLVRRAKLTARGHFLGPRWKYRLQMELGGASPCSAGAPVRCPYLEDAYIEWWMTPKVALRAGQYKVPFGFQRTMSSGGYEFVERSAAMNAFDLDRDLGLWVVGQPLDGRLQCQVGVMNGAGRNRPDDNIDKAYVARIVAQPLGKLPEQEGDAAASTAPLVSVGGAAHYNLAPTDVRQRDPNANDDVDADGRIDNVAILQLGGEARILFRGAALQGEVFWRREDPGVVARDRTFRGGYLQASYFVLPGSLQVGARGGSSYASLYGHKLAERLAAGSRNDELSGVVGWYVRGHDLKLQADYSYLVDRSVTEGTGASFDRTSQRVRVQMQLAF